MYCNGHPTIRRCVQATCPSLASSLAFKDASRMPGPSVPCDTMWHLLIVACCDKITCTAYLELNISVVICSVPSVSSYLGRSNSLSSHRDCLCCTTETYGRAPHHQRWRTLGPVHGVWERRDADFGGRAVHSQRAELPPANAHGRMRGI